MIDKEKLHQILSSLWKSGDNSVGKTYYNQALQDVQTAIDLQEESVSKELEEAANEYVDAFYAKLGTTQQEFPTDAIISKTDFKAGAKWQKAKDESTTEDLGEYINELSKQFPEVSFAKLSRIAVRVAKWQREQIMKGAIDARCFGFQGAALFSFRLPADNYLVGSEVKVIVVNYE